MGGGERRQRRERSKRGGAVSKARIKRESGQVVNNGFLAGLFRPILHKIITLLHPPRFLFRLHLLLASIFLPLDLLIFNALIR